MSQYLTIDRDRGNDGFGSQLLSILSGIAVCHVGDSVYVHSPIKDLKLVGHNHYVGAELIRANDMIDSVVKTLGYNNIKNQTPVLSLSFCYNEIINMGVDNYYTQEFQSTLSNAYPLQSPSYYKENTHNIAIHIRRGSDISKEDMKFRYIENEKYTVMVGKLLKKYPQSIIHIFCWGDIDLGIDSPNIQYHITEDGYSFLDDFNGLVHGDVLIVGSSTFSIAAGLFCRGTVLTNFDLMKLSNTPYPTEWTTNYTKTFGE